MSAAPTSARSLLAIGAAAGLIPLAFGLAHLHDPPAEALSGFLWGYALAGLPWIWVALRWRRLDDSPATGRWIFGLGLALRLLLVAVPPVLSEDAWRYLWDGLVGAAGLNPYGVAPLDPALDAVAGLSPGHAAVRAEVGHAHLPTVYPPLAQWGFEAVAWAAGPSLTALRLALALGDALVVWGLWRWLRRTGGPPQAAALYAFCPLAMVETAVGGHLDAWAVALLVFGAAALAVPARGRGLPRGALLGGALLGASAATKLLPLLALPVLVRRAPWALLSLAAVLAVTALPYLDAGPGALDGLSAYGTRWRGNAGLFDLLALPFERLWPPGPEPVDLPPGLVALARRLVGTPPGVDASRLWPDEAAFAAAKLLALLGLGAVGLWALWRARTVEELLAPTVLALCLLAPVVHPWYLAWPLALAVRAHAVRPRAWTVAVGVWAALAWLFHLPRIAWLAHGVWREPVWSRAVVHGAVWATLLLGAAVWRWRLAPASA